MDGDILVGAARANTGSTLTLADPASLALLRAPEKPEALFLSFTKLRVETSHEGRHLEVNYELAIRSLRHSR